MALRERTKPKASSRAVYVPAGVSSFFEVCDKNPDGSKISDILRIGSRGGGFIIKKGSITRIRKSSAGSDSVIINGRDAPEARTTRKVVSLMREKFEFGPVRVSHAIQPPIGSGFGTSGSGALGSAVAISDLFDLRLTLKQVSEFAHAAEIESMTGLGTVISLASGAGSIGLVTEPGCYSVGRVDCMLGIYEDLRLICASFGPMENSSVLSEEERKHKINEFGRYTMKAVLNEPTPESLLRHSRNFAEKTGIASKDLLQLADRALKFGAIGATQNMIGSAIHCLVPISRRRSFIRSFERLVPKSSIFETELIQSGPRLL